MNNINTPGFITESSIPGPKGRFCMVTQLEIVSAGHTVIMAQQDCPPGYHCTRTECVQYGCAECKPDIVQQPTCCTKSYWTGFCTDHCQDPNTGTWSQVSKTYWCTYGAGGKYNNPCPSGV